VLLLGSLNGYELGLLLVAGVFVAFALTVALVVPRARPDFPAKRLGAFLAVVIALFAAQMTAVLLLAELGEDEAEAVETEPTETQPTEPEPEGDPVAGKQVFLGPAGCGACHTLADAGTTGTVGPNLDAAKPSYEKAVAQVTNGGGGMPPFKDSLSAQQIEDVAAYVSSAAG
jgi:mono/diheme cytochrome c family protein